MTDTTRRLGMPNYVPRAILGILGAIQLTDGLYALFAPRSFYEDFPVGRGWVEALPAYNEHLTRDVGSLFIATAVILFAAAIRLERRLVTIALLSFLAFALPHFIYHSFNLEPYGTGDAIANAVGLALTVIAPIGLLIAMRRKPSARPPAAAGGNRNQRIAGVPESTRNPFVRMAYRSSRKRERRGPRPDADLRPPPDAARRVRRPGARHRARDARPRADQAPGRAAGSDARRVRVVPRLRLSDQHGRGRRSRGPSRAPGLRGERSLQRGRAPRHSTTRAA